MKISTEIKQRKSHYISIVKHQNLTCRSSVPRFTSTFQNQYRQDL